MGDRRSFIAAGLVALVLLVATGWIGLGGGDAFACTCGPADPVELVDASEVVFLGSATDHLDPDSYFPTLTFQVDTDVQGEVPESFEIAAGQTTWCGPAYALDSRRRVVYISRRQGHLGLTGCAPLVAADDFVRLARPEPLTLTPIDEVAYDVDAATDDFAELLASDRRQHERSIAIGPDRQWAYRLGLVSIAIAVAGAPASVVRVVFRPSRH